MTENKHGSLKHKNLANEVLSILLFSLSVFVLCALFSFNPADPSFFSNVHGVSANACGKIGAYLAAVLLQWFGLGAFLFPAGLFFLAAGLHKEEGGLRILGTLGGTAMAVSSLTVFLTLQWKYWPYSGTLLLTGGVFGAWIAKALVAQFNPLGSSLVSLAICAIALALSTPISVARFGAGVLRLAFKLSKMALGYLFYFLSVLTIRLAHFISDLLQRKVKRYIEIRAEMKVLASAKKVQLISEVKPEISKNENNEKAVLGNAAENNTINNSEIVKENNGENSLANSPVNNMTENNMTENSRQIHENQLKTQPSGVLPKIFPRQQGQEQVNGAQPLVAMLPPDEKASPKPKRPTSHQAKHWQLPTTEFLKKPPKTASLIDESKLLANSQILKQKFADFGIDGEVTAVRPGPVITLYEFKPGPGVKISRIAALADDLSMALSAQSVRILAPLPGKAVVGIEIPSEQREIVYLREFLQNDEFAKSKHSIPVVMGKDIGGQTFTSDLARMPHLLCAGQTGAGKSVFMNGLICSLFYRFTPDELRMILVDPKFIEFRAYQDIPHLFLPVVDDPKHASIALKWAVREMERRYRILAKLGARNLASFNQKVDDMGCDVVHDLLFAEENLSDAPIPSSGSDWIEAFNPDDNGVPRVGKLPYIVVIIDELADLMMVAKKEVEISIARIAQKARAAGIHLVIATQRPSTDVITGLIKANLPSRVSFQLASYVDSKTILDRAGAERLLGQGDMLFIPPGTSQAIRLHGAFVDDDEINKITAFLKSQGKPAYRDEILLVEDEDDEEGEPDGDGSDDLFGEAVELVKETGHASASFLQRKLKIGYNRAARMIETMELRGIVGPADGARPREVLMR